MPSRACRVKWQLWDLCVHLWPALMMLYNHGPSLGLGRSFSLGGGFFKHFFFYPDFLGK